MKIAVFHSLLVFQTRLLEIAFLGLVSCSMDRNSNSCDVGKYVIPELGQLCKQINVFYEIDIESQKENGCG